RLGSDPAHQIQRGDEAFAGHRLDRARDGWRSREGARGRMRRLRYKTDRARAVDWQDRSASARRGENVPVKGDKRRAAWATKKFRTFPRLIVLNAPSVRSCVSN